jgi:hypothetical protein
LEITKDVLGQLKSMGNRIEKEKLKIDPSSISNSL